MAPTPVEHPEPTVPPAVSGRRSRMHALRATSGQTLPLVVVFMFTMLIFAGLVIDLGNAYRVQQALQASTDASAAAGAGQLTMAFPPVARQRHPGGAEVRLASRVARTRSRVFPPPT